MAIAKPDGPPVRKPDLDLVRALGPSAVHEVRLRDIDVEDKTFQCRVQTDVRDLRRSLAAFGQQEPVDLLHGSPYRVIDGFRRCEAALELGWQSMRALVRQGLQDHDALRIAFQKNVVRRNLTPLDRANAIRLACDRGMNVAQLADAFGIGERQVSRYLAVLDYPEHLLDVLDGKVVTMAHVEVLKAFAVADADAWAKRIAAEDLSAAELRSQLRTQTEKPSRGRRRSYVHRKNGMMRVEQLTLRPGMDDRERQRVISALLEALHFARDLRVVPAAFRASEETAGSPRTMGAEADLADRTAGNP